MFVLKRPARYGVGYWLAGCYRFAQWAELDRVRPVLAYNDQMLSLTDPEWYFDREEVFADMLIDMLGLGADSEAGGLRVMILRAPAN